MKAKYHAKRTKNHLTIDKTKSSGSSVSFYLTLVVWSLDFEGGILILPR